MPMVNSNRIPFNRVGPENHEEDVHYSSDLHRIVDDLIATERPSPIRINSARSLKRVKFIIIGLVGILLIGLAGHAINNSLRSRTFTYREKSNRYAAVEIGETTARTSYKAEKNIQHTHNLIVQNHNANRNASKSKQGYQNKKEQITKHRNPLVAKRMVKPKEETHKFDLKPEEKRVHPESKPKDTKKYRQNIRPWIHRWAETRRKSDDYLTKRYFPSPHKRHDARVKKARKKLEEIVKRYMPRQKGRIGRRSYARYIPKPVTKKPLGRSYEFYRHIPQSRNYKSSEFRSNINRRYNARKNRIYKRHEAIRNNAYKRLYKRKFYGKDRF